MTPPKSLSRKGTDYRRKKSSNESSRGNKFLIVTEGAKTEPNYFEKFREFLGLKSIDVKIVHPEGTDPKTLVHAAINLKSKNEKEAKRQQERINGVVKYDEVWVVFDLEKTHDERRRLAREARDQAKAQNIQVAYSDPSFEYWLLLHLNDTTAPLKDSDEAVKRLKKHWPEYEKNKEFSSEFIEIKLHLIQSP